MFDASGKPHPDAACTMNAILEITDKTTNQVHRIKAKSPFVPHKTLGHWKAPAGKSKAHHDSIRDKCDKLLQALQSSMPNRNEAWKFYNAIFIPAVAYSLGQSLFSTQQLQELDRLTTGPILSACGYNRCTARAVTFAPGSFGGCDLIPFHVIQGSGQVRHFIKHWRASDPIGETLRIAVHWAQYHSGSGFGIFTHPDREIPAEETRWLKSTRAFLARIACSLELDKSGVYPTQRVHDRHLMDVAIESERFSSIQIQRLNYCRMWLNVTTVADIALANGTHIDPQFRCGDPSLLSSRSKWRPIHQGHPNPNSWKQRDRLVDMLVRADGKLLHPLGVWLQAGPNLDREWPYCYDPTQDRLWARQQNQQFTLYKREYFGCSNAVRTDPSAGVFGYPTPMPPERSLPAKCFPVHAEAVSNVLIDRYRLPGPVLGVKLHPRNMMDSANTIRQLRRELRPWEARLLANTQVSHSGLSEFAHEIVHPPVTARKTPFPCHSRHHSRYLPKPDESAGMGRFDVGRSDPRYRINDRTNDTEFHLTGPGVSGPCSPPVCCSVDTTQKRFVRYDDPNHQSGCQVDTNDTADEVV